MTAQPPGMRAEPTSGSRQPGGGGLPAAEPHAACPPETGLRPQPPPEHGAPARRQPPPCGPHRGATSSPSGAPQGAGPLWPHVRGVGTRRLPGPRHASRRRSSRWGSPGQGRPVWTAGPPGTPGLPQALSHARCLLGAGAGATTHRPGGRLGRAGLLEGDIEVVGAGVVGVGGDDRGGQHGVEGGAGLRVGGVGGHAGRVLRGVGAGRGRPAAHLVHGAAQQTELGLAGSGRREGDRPTVRLRRGSAARPGPPVRGVLLQGLKGPAAPSSQIFPRCPPPPTGHYLCRDELT